jgi:hypothetical protein
LKHGIELSESRGDSSGDGSPTAVLERGDSQSEFQLQGIFGVKVSTTVAAHNFELAVNGFDHVGGRKRFPHVLGVFQKRQVVEFIRPPRKTINWCLGFYGASTDPRGIE